MRSFRFSLIEFIPVICKIMNWNSRSDSFTLDDVTKVDSSLPETILATEVDIEEETPVASKDKAESDKVKATSEKYGFALNWIFSSRPKRKSQRQKRSLHQVDPTRPRDLPRRTSRAGRPPPSPRAATALLPFVRSVSTLEGIRLADWKSWRIFGLIP